MVWAALLGAATMATAAHAEPIKITVVNGLGVTSFDFDSRPTPSFISSDPNTAYRGADFSVNGMFNGQPTNMIFSVARDAVNSGFYGANQAFTVPYFSGNAQDTTFGGFFDLTDPAHPMFNSAPATYSWTSDGFASGPASLTVAPGAPGPEVGLGLSGVLAAMTALVLTRKRRAALA